MKKLLLTFAVLLGFALPGLAETAVFYVTDFTATDGYDNKFLVDATTFPENDILTGGGFNTVSASDMRAYANSSFTFTPKESVTITKIVFKDTNSKQPTISAKIDGTATTCSTSNRITTWEGTLSSSSTLTFSTTAQLRINHIEITYTMPATGSVDLADYVVYAAPSLDMSAEDAVNAKDSWTDQGIMVQYMLSGVVAKNTACTEKAVMTLNGTQIGDAMGVNDEFVIVGAYGAGGFAEGEGDSEGAQDFVIVFMTAPEDTWTPENGLYEMTIPAGFFTIDGKPIKEYKAQWRVGGVDYTPAFTDETLYIGDTFDAKTFITEESHPEITFAITEGNDFATIADGVITGVSEGAVTVTASWAAVEGLWNAGSATFTINVTEKPNFITDTFTKDSFSATSNQYKNGELTSDVTNITYCYSTATQYDAIQMNNSNGIAVKQNPNNYILSKIEVVWNSNTVNDRTLNIYGSSTDYKNATSISGDPLGAIAHASNETSYEVKDDQKYIYIAIKTAKSASYFDKITLYWIAPPAPTAPEFTLDPTEEGAEYTDISNYGHKVTITREEGVTYTYRLNEEEIEKELAENLVLTPGVESGIGYGTINNLTVIAKKGEQTIESEKTYFLTHPYASVSEGKIKLSSVAPAEHNVKIYYTIIDSAEPQAIRATRAAGAEYAAPVKLTTGQKIQYWAEAAHPVNEGETLKSAVVTNSLKDDGTLVGVDSIEADENAPVEFYTIDGLRVAEPENGLYIVRQGNKVYKVIIRK